MEGLDPKPFKIGEVYFGYNQIWIRDAKAKGFVDNLKGDYEAGGRSDGSTAWISLDAEHGDAKLKFCRDIPVATINEHIRSGILLTLAIPSRKIVFQSVEDIEANYVFTLDVDWTENPAVHLLLAERPNAVKPHRDPDLWIFFVDRPEDYPWPRRPVVASYQPWKPKQRKGPRKLSPLAGGLFWVWKKLRFK